MKKVLISILLIAPSVGWTEKPKPNPADYTITVHVQSSQLVEFSGDVTQGSSVSGWQQKLSVIIDGKKYELQSGFKIELLRVGDYKAKITEDETLHSYEYLRTYEFLFPDGQTRQYFVVGESE
jgi:hypothetical protein